MGVGKRALVTCRCLTLCDEAQNNWSGAVAVTEEMQA